MLFEADMKLSEVTGEGRFRISNRTSSSVVEAMTYLDITVKDGRVSFGNEKWAIGFNKKDVASADGFKLRLELYLDPTERLDDQKNKKCSAIRVFVDGEYLGKIVNNDGGEPGFPSGYILCTSTKLIFEALENSGAVLEIESLRYSYAG